MKSGALILCMLFAGCLNLRHHEQVTPQWTSSPGQQVDCYTNAQQIILAGHSQGQDIYVQNPIVYCNDSIERYCVYSVWINNNITVSADSLAQPVFKIPLAHFGIQKGDSIYVVINHMNGGMPVVLNPQVH